MKVTNFLPSRAACFLDPASTNNQVFVPDIAAEIRQEFRFVDGPITAKDYDSGAGITFLYGTFRGVVVQKLQLYVNGMIAEAVSRTDYLDEVLESVKGILVSRFGLNFTEAEPISRIHNSSIEVKLSNDFSHLFVNMTKLSKLFSSMLDAYGLDISNVEPGGFRIIPDAVKSNSPIKPDPFVLERRTGHAFEDCLFFSSAPLSTQQHIELLEELESLL